MVSFGVIAFLRFSFPGYGSSKPFRFPRVRMLIYFFCSWLTITGGPMLQGDFLESWRSKEDTRALFACWFGSDHLVWFGWFGSDHLVWFGWFGSDHLVWFGFVGLVWFGLVWFLVWFVFFGFSAPSLVWSLVVLGFEPPLEGKWAVYHRFGSKPPLFA